MRVTGGTVSGVRLKSPGKSAIRPTTGLIREAIFSMLQSLVDNWSRVLDLYAGTGSLGIEALSRGAEWVDFVENNQKQCAVIKRNLEQTGFNTQAHIYRCSVKKALSILEKPYNVIFLDPPYSDLSLVDTINDIANSKIIEPETVIVVQHSSHQILPEEIKKLKLVKTKRHGDTSITIYGQEEMH